MKKSIVLLVAALFLNAGVASAINMDPLYSLETITIDSFDTGSVYPGSTDPIEWVVRASKASAPDFPKYLMANTWPQDKFGDNPADADTLRALAINASFIRRGDNWLEIAPSRGGKIEPLPLTGHVLALGVWVWGSNYDYQLDACFIDAEGIEHRLPMGSLNFMGWKNMTVEIPARIRQSIKQFPPLTQLRFSKFIVTTNIKEKSDNFYLYMDNITSFSQVSLFSSYDGHNLTQPDTVNAIWAQQQTAPAANTTPAANTNPDQPLSATDPSAAPAIGQDNPAFQKLQEISVSKMEDPAFWVPQMSSDFGYAALRSFANAPAAKQPIAGEDQSNAGGEDVNVIGARIQFIRRGVTSFFLKSVRPIPVEGVVKVVSVWVAGRNAPHKLVLLVRDFNGKINELPMGSLAFSGWKQMSVAIPSSVKQNDARFNDRAGLSIEGFRVDFDLNDTYGSYYIYMDDLRALTDMYAVTEARDADDPNDQW